MAYTVSDENKALYKDAFAKAGATGDDGGSIGVAKLADVVGAVSDPKVTEKQIKRVMKEKDAETIAFVDFVKLVETALERQDEVEREMRTMFKFYDADGNGSVTKDEFRKVMADMGISLSEKEVEEVIGGSDADGDGTMKYEEFTEWYKNN